MSRRCTNQGATRTMFLEERKEIGVFIKNNNYGSLRVSVFEDENTNLEEWQVRIDYDTFSKKYRVYGLGERAVLMGKMRFFLIVLKMLKNGFLSVWIIKCQAIEWLLQIMTGYLTHHLYGIKNR